MELLTDRTPALCHSPHLLQGRPTVIARLKHWSCMTPDAVVPNGTANAISRDDEQ